MEFLVKFIVTVPRGVEASEVEKRRAEETRAAAELVRRGHLRRLWNGDDGSILGLYRASSRHALDALLADLPLRPWMTITVIKLGAHPSDPGQ